MKAGTLEIADIVVINKADRIGADKMEYEIRSAFELGLRKRNDVPILLTQAFNSKGVPELLEAVDEFVKSRRESGAFVERRKRNMEIRIRTLVDYMVQKNVWDGKEDQLAKLVEKVLNHKTSAYEAAEEIVS